VTRALILAGGGLKVAFQAGVLQVWLDEAGLEFDVYDAASGGVFNLALLCDGRSGTEIADTWRRTKPLDFFELNPRPWVSLSRLERFRRNVLRPVWQIDWNRVRASGKKATFNVYDYAAEELLPIPAEEMTEDLLVAGVSLPIWFPPVEIGGRTLIDSVFATDSNLEAAIRAGADDLWIIWTVPMEGKWRSWPVPEYFAMVENAAVWNLKDLLRRIDASNDSIERYGHGEFPHPVNYRILKADYVPLHYVLVFSQTRVQQAVELGVQAARRWCDENEIERPFAPPGGDDPSTLRFTETMRGAVGFGIDDPELAWKAPSGDELSVRLTVEIEGVGSFLADPQHEARLTGEVTSEALGGRLDVERGTFNLFVPGDDGRQRMLYRVHFKDGAGHPLTLTGEKLVPQLPSGGPWVDTTTLYVRVLRGDIDAADEAGAEVAAAGILRISPPGFLRQLLTFRAEEDGEGLIAGARLVARYFAFFVSTVADVYLRRSASIAAPRSELSQTNRK
jgi:predicted patatin/cPLA2 family phospholipase